MIKEERLAKLIDYVRMRQYVGIDELMKLLGVSKATVRRDLLQLEEEGLVSLTRGGATLANIDIPHEPTYREKEEINILEKQKIGEIAAGLIHSGDTVFIGAGTTTRSIVQHLNSFQNLNLVTNDLMIAADATGFTNVDVTVTGGQLRKNYYTLRGFAAENYVSRMNIDIAFWGMDAIDPINGCFIANADEVALSQKVIASAGKVVILCDHTKFYNKAFMLVCPLNDIDTIITDTQLDSNMVALFEEKGLEVILI